MTDILGALAALDAEATAALEAATDEAALELVRVRYLGRKGDLAAILRGLADVDPAQRPEIGKQANEVKQRLEAALAARRETLLAAARSVTRFREASSPSTWLYTIARSFCIKKRRRSKFAPAAVVPIDGEGREAVLEVPDPRHGPEQELDERRLAAALDAGHMGLVSYALTTDDADEELARLRADGSDLGDVEARSRTRPDGEVVRWRAAFPPLLGPAEPPFILEHELLGAEWGGEARAARASFAHPIGGPVRITTVELPVPDIEATATACARSVGVQFSDIDPRSAHAAIGSQVVRLHHGAPLWNPAVVEISVGGTRELAGREIDAVGVRWRIRS